MRPSEVIISLSNKPNFVIDKAGRRIGIRPLTALDTLRLFKAAGPDLSQNEAWLAMAGLAYAATTIDDIPVPIPVTEMQIESVVEKLGDDGLVAIAKGLDLNQVSPESLDHLGNSLGTPS